MSPRRLSRGAPSYTSGVDDDEHPVAVLARAVGIFGRVWDSLMLLGLAIAFLVMGHTAGRMVGAALLVIAVAMAWPVVRRFTRLSPER